jgi:hypothetical protein
MRNLSIFRRDAIAHKVANVQVELRASCASKYDDMYKLVNLPLTHVNISAPSFLQFC